MARRTDTGFVALRIEGGLLPSEFLLTVAASEAGDQDNATYGLTRSLHLRDEIGRFFRIAADLYADFRARPDDAQAAVDGWLAPLLAHVFGYRALEPVPAPPELENRRFPITHQALGGPVPMVLASPALGLDTAHARFGDEGRRRTAMGLLQELLNASEEQLWGVASDGKVLRLLRKNPSFTRPAWIELDLERTFEDAIYADFAAFWLLAHGTRLEPREAGNPATCILERWRQVAVQTGERAKAKLRDGVARALLTLGEGFVRHPANDSLRQKLKYGDLTADQLHQQLLRLVYRFLFLFVVEDRNLLHPPGTSARARDLWAEGYGVGHLRERSLRPRLYDAHGDLWQGLKISFMALERGAPEIGAPALDGGLFNRAKIADLFAAELSNAALLGAIKALAFFRPERARSLARVNYRDLGTEELGSVYESLLELHPVVEREPWGFRYVGLNGDAIRGHERKLSGSYYTPVSLVQELIKSALEPVIRKTATDHPYDQRRALLALRILDPACGSGHFLLAAARRLAYEIARLDAAPDAPTEAQRQHALREVVRHCIYGVELCKTALWIETVEPGRPLSFLDHRIREGDSLIGVFDIQLIEDGIPEKAYQPKTGDDPKVARDLKARNRDERKGQRTLGLAPPQIEAVRIELAKAGHALGAHGEDDLGAMAHKEEVFQRLHASDGWRRLKDACDLWTAAFFAPLQKPAPGQPERIPTTDTVRKALAGKTPQALRSLLFELEDQCFFHWPLEFPEVFDPARPAAERGFDVVLGNPPWERIKLQEQEFFAERHEGIALAPNKAARACMIKALATSDNPAERKLYDDFRRALHAADAASMFVRGSGRFPLTATGDVNTYALFAESFLRLINARGRAGVIVPLGIATDDSTKRFFGELISTTSLASLLAFENEEFIFRGLHHAYRFALLTLRGDGRGTQPEFAFFCRRPEHLADRSRRFTLSPDDIALINPNTRTCPIFRTGHDAELTKAIYRRVPVLIDESGGEAGNPWGIRFMAMFHMANDSGLFRTFTQLREAGGELTGTTWTLPNEERWLPLYEAKLIHHFDHRWASYGEDGREAGDLSEAEKADPSFRALPRYWVEAREVYLRIADLPKGLLVALRDRNTELIVLGLAHLLFGPWLRQKAGNTVSETMRNLLPAWRSFIVHHSFARDIAPTQLGLCGDNPPYMMPEGPQYLPAQPLDAIEDGKRTKTAWYAADEQSVAAYLRFAGKYQDLADSAPRLTCEAEALAYAEACLEQASPQWLMGWRDITGVEKVRTVIASALPRAAVGHTTPLFFSDETPKLFAAFLANWCSLALDFCARQKVGGTHLTFSFLKQFPFLPPSAYSERDLDFIVPRVLELTYTAWDMQPFAQDLGHEGEPFPWDPERRAVLRAELDAYFAWLYGLTRDELRYVLDPKEVMGEDWPSETFRVLKERELREHGEYRTRRLELDAFDRFHEDGTVDPARTRDPHYLPQIQRAYGEVKARLEASEQQRSELELLYRRLLGRADETRKPVLFVEGATDVPVIEAAWDVFFPDEERPFEVLAAEGTLQMRALATPGKAMRRLLGDRLVLALADNDGAGRLLWDEGNLHKGGVWKQQTNGVHWCLLQPSVEFRTVMERLGVPSSLWPFVLENAFSPGVRRQAMAEVAYALSDQLFDDLGRAPDLVRKLPALFKELPDDDPTWLYLLAPTPDAKETFAAWISAPERRTPENYASFRVTVERLKQLLERHQAGEGRQARLL